MKITPLQKLSFLALRVMSSLIFLTAGLNHLVSSNGVADRLTKAELGYLATSIVPVPALVVLSGVGLLAGGLALLVGYKTRLASVLLLSILIPITVTVQVFNPAGMGPFFKNVALMGVLLFFSANGALYYGLDQFLLLKRRVQGKSFLRSGSYAALLVLGLALVTGACTTSGTAVQTGTRQDVASGQKDYAVLISQPNHLKAAIQTAETIGAGSPYYRNRFVVMACGKSVEAFVKGGSMQEELRQGKRAGITYKVCGLSLKQFNLDPASLVEGIEVVPNGLTYMFDLQQQGYSTVEL